MTNYVGSYRMLETFRRHLAENNAGHNACAAMPTASHPDPLTQKSRVETIRTNEAGLFLHVSTDEVFGALGYGDSPFNENSPYAPNSPYSASKAGSDHMARAYHHTYGLPVITTHCSNNYGPWQYPEKLLPLMIRKALRGEPLPVYGDGTQIRDWIHVSDHCRALAMLLCRGTPGRSYVIGGNCEIRNIDLVRCLINLLLELAPDRVKGPAEKMITFVADRPGHDFRYALDPSRITRELGWHPLTDFASGLRQTVQWYLDHPDFLEA